MQEKKERVSKRRSRIAHLKQRSGKERRLSE